MRPHLLHAAIRVSVVSVALALTVGIAAIVSGAAAHSLALVGFGLDSVIDGSASVVLVWRFRVERRDPERSERVEHAAHRLVGLALLVVAFYIAAEASRSLVNGTGPNNTEIGIALAAASLAVLPALAVLKLRLAAQLRSRALRADGVLSAAGAVLAFIALLGLTLNNAFGWWWSDAAAAAIMALFLGREGCLALWPSSSLG